jgi:anti-anti-sigma factor
MGSPTTHLPPKVEQSGNVRVITFSADQVRDVENMFARQLAGRTDGLEESHLLLNFSNVEYLNGAELGTLITLHQRMKACGGRLTLFNLNDRVYEVFTITRLQTFLGICREEMTNPGGGGSTTIIKNKVDGAEETASDYPGDPDKFADCEEADTWTAKTPRAFTITAAAGRAWRTA